MTLSDLRIEDQLLLCCARSAIDGETADRIRLLSGGHPDWAYFLVRASHHRVVPLVHRALVRFGAGTVAGEVANALAGQALAIAHRNLLLTAELTRIVAWLEGEGIQVVPYKGPTLATMAYGNLALRQFGDLDFLVQPRDYQRVIELFVAQGWLFHREFEWECTVRDEKRALDVDLHRDLAPEAFAVRSLVDGAWTRLASATIAGKQVPVVGAEDMLLVLGVQLVKDAWGGSDLRLAKLVDVAEILRTLPDLDWEEVRLRARRSGCLKMLSVAVTLAAELLGAPRCELRYKVPRAEMTRLHRHVTARFFHHPAHPLPAAMLQAEFYSLARERWRDRFFPTYVDLKRRLPPNELDFAVVALPERLKFLYYVIRPFRLARDLIALAYAALTSR